MYAVITGIFFGCLLSTVIFSFMGNYLYAIVSGCLSFIVGVVGKKMLRM